MPNQNERSAAEVPTPTDIAAIRERATLRRFGPGMSAVDWGDIIERPEGDYVLFADAEAALAERDREIAEAVAGERRSQGGTENGSSTNQEQQMILDLDQCEREWADAAKKETDAATCAYKWMPRLIEYARGLEDDVVARSEEMETWML